MIDKLQDQCRLFAGGQPFEGLQRVVLAAERWTSTSGIISNDGFNGSPQTGSKHEETEEEADIRKDLYSVIVPRAVIVKGQDSHDDIDKGERRLLGTAEVVASVKLEPSSSPEHVTEEGVEGG